MYALFTILCKHIYKYVGIIRNKLNTKKSCIFNWFSIKFSNNSNLIWLFSNQSKNLYVSLYSILFNILFPFEKIEWPSPYKILRNLVCLERGEGLYRLKVESILNLKKIVFGMRAFFCPKCEKIALRSLWKRPTSIIIKI